MKKLFLLLIVLFITVAVFSQDTPSLVSPNPMLVGADSANYALREVTIDRFEREASWNVDISPDHGLITGRFFEGGPDPLAKDPQGDGSINPEDTRAFGVKVDFYRRGVNTFYVTPSQPLAIDGVSKTVSLWVAGRNQPHTLTLLLRDFFGNSFELYMGDLNFTGWKKMVVAVPPSPDGTRGIVQDSAYFGERPGLTVIGFRVDCDPMYASGQFYLYLDDLRVVSDLYAFENSDPYDLDDNW